MYSGPVLEGIRVKTSSKDSSFFFLSCSFSLTSMTGNIHRQEKSSFPSLTEQLSWFERTECWKPDNFGRIWSQFWWIVTLEMWSFACYFACTQSLKHESFREFQSDRISLRPTLCLILISRYQPDIQAWFICAVKQLSSRSCSLSCLGSSAAFATLTLWAVQHHWALLLPPAATLYYQGDNNLF